mmetsp:Transcript_391/g.815  ORF Transcript_391/g.815 Transcript_391/m.815 type:complete len:141 (-) Transcript_391:271-693(-)
MATWRPAVAGGVSEHIADDDSVSSLDDAGATGGWIWWLWGSCGACCQGLPRRPRATWHQLPHHLSDPLMLGPPVAEMPRHVVYGSDGGAAGTIGRTSSSIGSAAAKWQGGVELKPARPNPLLGQWNRLGDRSFVAARPHA